jgi:hypothetical protein
MKLHGPAIVEEIKSKAVYLFWTNDKRIQHNLEMLVKLNNLSNPTAILKTQSVCSKYAKGVNSHFDTKYPATAMLCVGAKVAIQGKNFQPLWGLHNGACGIVKEIIFSPGQSPNNGFLPKYVVCDFPLYCGPIWDPDNPSVRIFSFDFIPGINFNDLFHFNLLLFIPLQYVPIPTITTGCRYKGCCTRTFTPLDLAFARTIHTFQGLSAGPVDFGKIPNMYECIVCDPDIKKSEVRATGLFYTALSRATTLGDDDGLNSAIYFIGNNITRERIQQVTMQADRNHELINVTRRRNWVHYLNQHTMKPESMTTARVKKVSEWLKCIIPYSKLHARIQQYISESN